MNRLIAATALSLWLLPACSSEFVVVSSSASQLRPSHTVKSGTVITLDAGEQVTFIRDDGMELRFSGPGQHSLSSSEPASVVAGLVQAISRLLGARSEDEPVEGAWRGDSLGEAAQARLLGVQLDRKGTYCTPADGSPLVWRGFDDDAERYAVTGEADGATATIRWARSESTTRWPASVPVIDGAAYHVHLLDVDETLGLTVRLLPPEVAVPAHRVAWMAEHGCEAQAQRLLDILIPR